MVIPFTLCSLPSPGNDMTRERARWSNYHHPGQPALAVNHQRFAVPSAYSFRAYRDGGCNVPVKLSLGASMRLAPPAGNASAIYSRTRASLNAPVILEGSVIASVCE
ncbi:hypothetical protein KIF59_19155 [Enterobacter cloacae subsp. cloacae]|nr:hypothetical protein [Enterobacter cloacae subsp. cloacae]